MAKKTSFTITPAHGKPFTVNVGSSVVYCYSGPKLLNELSHPGFREVYTVSSIHGGKDPFLGLGGHFAAWDETGRACNGSTDGHLEEFNVENEKYHAEIMQGYREQSDAITLVRRMNGEAWVRLVKDSDARAKLLALINQVVQ